MSFNEPPSFAAIRKNDIARMSLLISKGRINFRHSASLLQYAALLGRLEIMRLLLDLDAGADIDAVDDKSECACSVAIEYGRINSLRFLLARGANIRNGVLLRAATRCNTDTMAITLLDAGASLENLSDDALIMLLTRWHSIPVLQRLLARDVDVSALRGGYNRKCSILHLLVTKFSHAEDFIRAVVHLGGADVNAVDQHGQTPLHFVALQDHINLVRVLVELGANVDQQDARGRTALISSWEAACTPLLLTLATDVTLATVDGRTACHFATGGIALLPMVVALGGDVDQPDNKGETPRMIAIGHSFPLPTADEIEAARRRIAKDRLDLVRQRAFQICVGLQSLRLNSLQLCEIMMHSFGALGSLIAFHQWWAIATTVKHFRARKGC